MFLATSVPVQALPAAYNYAQGLLLSPSDASTYFQQLDPSEARTDLFYTSASPRVEVEELAAGLGKDVLSQADYVAAAYKYVLQNVRTEYRFGLSKGAVGAIIDKSGTPFDQADLLYQLLKKGGVAPKLEYGVATLTGAQFAAWTGITSAKAACQLLANGGVSAIVNGTTLSDCSYTGTVSTISFNHIWVAVGTQRFDPSFKSISFPGGSDMASLLGCGTECATGATAAAMTGAFQVAGATPYIQQVNANALDVQLRQYATALQEYLRTNSQANISIEALVGSSRIVYDPNPPFGTLPYSYSTNNIWDTIPDIYRTKVLYKFDGIYLPTYADESSNSVINLMTNCSGSDRTSYLLWNVRSSSGRIEPQPVGSTVQFSRTGSNPSNSLVEITVNHPYPGRSTAQAATGTYGDETISRSIYRDMVGSPSCGILNANLLADIGAAGSGRLQALRELRYAMGGALNSNTPLVSLYHQFLVQGARAGDILAGLSRTHFAHHHSFGFLLRATSSSAFVLSVEGLASTTQADGTDDGGATKDAYSVLLSGLEGSVPTQSYQSWNGGSSVSMFSLANEKGYRFYDTTTANLASVKAVLSGYNSSQLGLIDQYVNTAQNYKGILVETGSIGSFSFQSGASVTWNNTPFVFTRRGVSGAADSFAYLNGELAKGSGSSAGLQPDPLATTKPATATGKLFERPAIDLTMGSMSLDFPDKIVDGSGAGRLSYSVHYSTGDMGEIEPYDFNCQTFPCTIEYGWKGPWSKVGGSTAQLAGDGFAGLGANGGWHAASSIAAIKALLDLSGGTPTFAQRLTAIFVADSLAFELAGNVITTHDITGSKTFIRLPDKSAYLGAGDLAERAYILGPARVRATLAGLPYLYDSSMTIDVYDRNGKKSSFSPDSLNPVGYGSYLYQNNFALSSSLDPSGLKTTYQYVVVPYYTAGIWGGYSTFYRSRPKTLSTSVGSQLTFSYETGTDFGTGQQVENGNILSITTSTGRQITWHTDGGSGYVFEFLPDGTSLRFSDGTNITAEPKIIKQVLVPAHSAQPLYQIEYDQRTRAKALIDAAGKRTDYYLTGGYGGDREFALRVLPDGGKESSILSSKGGAVSATDPLGRTSLSEYDGAGRLTRKVNPEGDAVEYTYDVRGNRLQECRIPKERAGLACNPAAGDLTVTTTYMEGPTVLACAQPKTCNKPSYEIDARGNRTDYTWSSTHGQLLTVTGPADGAGVRPVTTYGYSAFTGSDGATFYLLTSKAEKISASVTTTTTYGYDTANKFALKEAVTDSGGLNLRQCFKFDAGGNLISKTEPKAGLASCP